jgi:starch-binding outer membrane protein SusE/F
MRKNIFLIASLFGLFSFFACEKDAPTAVLNESVTPNELQNLSASDYVLTLETASEVFETFEWVAPDYGFVASSKYILQADVEGNNFGKAFEVLSTDNKLTGSITIGELNKKMLTAEIDFDVPVMMEFRVVSIINSNVDTVYSTVKSATVTAYPTDFPPIYMCGAATGGWDWTKGVEVRSSAPKVYNTIAHFVQGETFRFFAQANWGPTSYNYDYFTTVDTDLENALDGDHNFKVVSVTGWYDITCDLKTKVVTMSPVAEPKMFMTGAAVGGWNWTTDYVQMTWTANGMFEATTDFINGEAFRFFAQADWGPTSYNYPYFPAGSVDPLFENANDGDKNFKFIGTTGNFKIKLNMLDKVVTMTAAK